MCGVSHEFTQIGNCSILLSLKSWEGKFAQKCGAALIYEMVGFNTGCVVLTLLHVETYIQQIIVCCNNIKSNNHCPISAVNSKVTVWFHHVLQTVPLGWGKS